MIVYITYTGTITYGYDQTGVFGPANTYLTPGDTYIATYEFNTERGLSTKVPLTTLLWAGMAPSHFSPLLAWALQ
jgi:hypothetical protein